MATVFPVGNESGVDDALVEARSALARTGVDALAGTFACLARYPATLDAEQGRQALIEALICFVQALTSGRAAEACDIVAECDPTVA